jgi:hypothetical protein
MLWLGRPALRDGVFSGFFLVTTTMVNGTMTHERREILGYDRAICGYGLGGHFLVFRVFVFFLIPYNLG